jgi:hypothetical protein
MRKLAPFLLIFLSSAHAHDVFVDGVGGAKVHEASGFICPLKIADFERDAVGQRDPQTDTDYCAYSALDGVYGTVMLRPLPKTYDPKVMLESDFALQEGAGGKILGEWFQSVGARSAPLTAYVRSYETARLEATHYRALLASAVVGAWSVQVTVEYADPKDKLLERDFLNAAYEAAVAKIPPVKP